MAIVALATTVSAEPQFFIGADMVRHTTHASLVFEGSATVNNVSYARYALYGSDNDTSPNFKAGMIDKDYRVYVNFDKAYDEYTVSYSSVNLNYDRFFNISTQTDLYVGGHIGQGEFGILGRKDSGFQFGFQAGLIQNITENISFEVGYKYTIASAVIEQSGSGSGSIYVNGQNVNYSYSGTATAKVKNTAALLVGVNYKF